LDDEIIFIVGYSRSGTKMMKKILDESEEIYAFGELHFWGRLWDEKDKNRVINYSEGWKILKKLWEQANMGFNTVLKESVHEIFQTCKKDKLRFVHEYYFYFLMGITQKNRKSIPCDPTPRNIYYLNEIKELFPQSKFVYMLRDPRDCLSSQKRKPGSVLKQKGRVYESLRLYFNYQLYLISKFRKTSLTIFLNNFVRQAQII
jgi:hypothetical protein